MSIYCNFVESFEPRARSLIESHPPDDGTDDVTSYPSAKGPKLFAGSIKVPEEIWTVRQGLSGDEELYARSKSVYWTRNNRIVKSFNFTDYVMKVFWAEFSEQDHVIIALTSGLSIFNKMGQHFQIPLPFPYQEMYVSKLGILIERTFDTLEESSSLPVLFSLIHPTREIAPILFKSPSRSDHLTYIVPNCMSMVACHDKLSLCLMYNSQDCRHSIWRLRKATDGEIEGFQKDTTNTYNQSSCSFVLGNLAASRLGAGIGASQMTPDHTRSFKTNMTPNRNRIINYLRDNIEDPILPELTCEQIWSENAGNTLKGSKFFITRDFVGDQFFVIVIPASSQLKIIKFSVLHQDSCDIAIGKSSHISAIDAMPINTMNMMIVLEVNKNLALYSGLDRVTTVNVQQLSSPIMPTSTPTPNKTPSEITPIQMSSARKRSSVGDYNSIGSDTSIQQMLALSPVPHVSKQDAIKKIDHTVGNKVFLRGAGAKQICFQIPPISQTRLVESLIEAMKRLVSRDQGLLIASQWYQTRRSPTQSELMPARDEVKLFRTWFINFIGIEGDIFNLQNPKVCESFIHKVPSSSPSKRSRKAKEPEVISITPDTYSLFFAMHLVFEDLLLMKLCYDIAYDLVELLLVLACFLKLDRYQNYYWLKFPQLQERYGPMRSKLESVFTRPASLTNQDFFSTNPPSVIEFLERIISASCSDEIGNFPPLDPYPNLTDITSESFAIISLFCEMYNINKDKAIVSISSATLNYTKTNVLSKKPFRSISADQAVVIWMIKLGKDRSYLSRLPHGYSLHLWDSILNCRESPPTDWCEGCFELIGRMDLVSLVRGYDKVKNKGKETNDGDEDETLKLLFPDDIRVNEAQRMLASDVPVEFSVTSRQGATEEESRDETHRHLYLLNVRTMGMPVGRGAISLRTYPPVIGESFEVPRLELSGRILSEDRPIEYTHDISVYPWPYFHNGVAAGLTISAASSNNIIDSTWINYNRPRSNIAHGTDIRDRDLTTVNINNEHAGFLFALGLNGHLEKLSLMALHDYLCQNNDLTKLAILLGMSAVKRGSRDNNIIKVLSIHVDALLPPNSTELDVPALVHAASIIGVGLLYLGSADSHISKVLLEEIGRLPGPEANSHVDRESYSLSAGLAFGLVNLCKGGVTTISSSDQLRLYMLGGKRKPLTLAQKERYFKQDCHRGEEEYINTHITGPGGTLGLGLMYHRSGNQSVANWMRAPDTQTLLEYVRPDFLILRMLSYGLIMWDEVEPSENWINSHIPKIVSTHAFQRSLSPGPNRLVDSSAVNNQSTDYELISQAYCNIVAGCCMAIALRYAGSANKNAYKTIYKHTKMLIALSNKPALAEQAGRPCIEACLNVLVTSLAVVMAGTGDLGVMRVCRYLRSRLTQSCVFYGSYMAIHMALGILFLGSCRYSFSTSPDSIGALVCALYPIYPNHSSDNRYHLQALRHLYVLAAEPRLVVPRDITTGKPVYVGVTIRKKIAETGEIEELKLKAPCLLPEVDSIESVFVDDERYWRIEISDSDALARCLLKDNGYLSVKRKAHSSNNQLVQDIETYILQKLPKGCMKSRKESALRECVKEDRVEQYSAINELLTKNQKVDLRFKCLTLEQLRLACSLVDKEITNKLNILKPIIGEINDSLSSEHVYDDWFKYLAKEKDWTNTDARVAQYIVLNDLRCSQSAETEILRSLRELDLHIKEVE